MYPALGAIRFELVAAILVFISIALKGKGLNNFLPKENSINKAAFIYFVLGMLSMLVSVDFTTSWNNGGYTLLKLMLFYVMVVVSLNTASDLNKLMWGVILITSWIAYEPFYNYFTGRVVEYGYGEVAYGRFGVATGHVALANTLSQTVPIAYYWMVSQNNKLHKMVSFLLFVLIVIGVVISKSRGGFVALMAVAMGIIFLSPNRIKTSFVVLLCFVILLPFAGQDYLSRVSTIAGGISQSRSTEDRYIGLMNGISMMVKRPILGVGIGCYATARLRYFNYYFYSHNLYGELFGELGLASISWFLWIYLIFKKCVPLKNRISNIRTLEGNAYYNVLCSVQVGLFTRLIVGNFSHCQMIWFWFLMAGIVIGVQTINNVKDEMLVPESLETD